MNFRDTVAIAALHVLAADGPPEAVAKRCYGIADAFIAARHQKEEVRRPTARSWSDLHSDGTPVALPEREGNASDRGNQSTDQG